MRDGPRGAACRSAENTSRACIRTIPMPPQPQTKSPATRGALGGKFGGGVTGLHFPLSRSKRQPAFCSTLRSTTPPQLAPERFMR
jgi:hypothetical protein